MCDHQGWPLALAAHGLTQIKGRPVLLAHNLPTASGNCLYPSDRNSSFPGAPQEKRRRLYNRHKISLIDLFNPTSIHATSGISIKHIYNATEVVKLHAGTPSHCSKERQKLERESRRVQFDNVTVLGFQTMVPAYRPSHFRHG